MCVEGYTDAGVDLGPQVGPWEALVSGEGPAEPGLPRVAGDDTAEGGEEDEAAEEDGTALVTERLIVDVEDGGAGGGGEEGVEVAEREEHGDDVAEGRDEADAHCADDSGGDNSLWLLYLEGHVGCAVETGEGPCGVDETHDEGDTRVLPAGLIIESGEDELCVVELTRGAREDSNGDGEEGEEGDV